MKITFITTGGTIDKIYFDSKNEYEVGPPQVAELLRDVNATFEFQIESVLRKDSLDMTEADRQLIRERVAAAATERVVVTHGTWHRHPHRNGEDAARYPGQNHRAHRLYAAGAISGH
jgi:L-asparaginase